MVLAKRRNRKSFLEKVVFSYRFILLLVLTVLVSLAYVRLRFEQTVIGYDISLNEKKKEEALNEKLFLEAQYKRLKSAKSVEKVARELGFKFPTQDDVIYIDQITVVGEKR